MRFRGDDIETDSLVNINSWETPLINVRYLTYDPDEEIFYMGNFDSDIYAVSRDCETIERYEQDISPRGAGWHAMDADGYFLYFLTRIRQENVNRVKKMNPATGDIITVAEFSLDESTSFPMAADISNTWNPLVASLVVVFDNEEEADSVASWTIGHNDVASLELDTDEGTLPGDSTASMDILFRGLELEPGEILRYQLDFSSNACVEEDETRVNITLEISALGIKENPGAQPGEWSFNGAYPNPFNPTLTVAFTLKNSTHVNGRIFNLLGQQVAILINEKMTVGHHSVTFDGSELASGMYFLRFEAGPLHEIKKVVLLK
jgi:hypothetical protein